MSVRVKFELLIPGFETVKDLQEYCSMQDALDSEEGEAIAPQHVKGSDVLSYYFLGRMPNIALAEGAILTGYPEEIITVDELEET